MFAVSNVLHDRHLLFNLYIAMVFLFREGRKETRICLEYQYFILKITKCVHFISKAELQR